MAGAALRASELTHSTRSPQLRVSVGDRILSGAFQAEVVSTNHYAADRFSVTAALDGDPWATAGFWSSEVDFRIEVLLSVSPSSGFTSLIQGLADTVSIDPIGRVVHLAGRDHTAALIEARTQETFANRTASEIATLLAQRHGLIPRIVPTTTLVGRYYEGGYGKTTLDQYSRTTTEWDLLVSLARHERFDVFVRAAELHFLPTSSFGSADRVLVPPDATRLVLHRSLTLARDIEVTVRTWNSQKGQALVESVRSNLSRSEVSNSGSQSRSSQHFALIRPNLSSESARRLAQQLADEVCHHERVIEISMPGDVTLTPGSVVFFGGTDTEFDQSYYVDAIKRVIQPRSGFIQHMSLRSPSPRSASIPGMDFGADTGK